MVKKRKKKTEKKIQKLKNERERERAGERERAEGQFGHFTWGQFAGCVSGGGRISPHFYFGMFHLCIAKS